MKIVELVDEDGSA